MADIAGTHYIYIASRQNEPMRVICPLHPIRQNDRNQNCSLPEMLSGHQWFCGEHTNRQVDRNVRVLDHLCELLEGDLAVSVEIGLHDCFVDNLHGQTDGA